MKTQNTELVTTNGSEVRINPETPRGTFIPAEAIEKAVAMERTDHRYGLVLLKLVEEFHRDTAAFDHSKIIRREASGLRILTDEEAVGYVNSRYWACIRGAKNIHERGEAAIRVGELSTETQVEHDRLASCRSRMNAAIAREAKRLKKHQELILGC